MTTSQSHSTLSLQQDVHDALDPFSAPLPAPWSDRLDAFQRLLLLRVLRPDKLTMGMAAFTAITLGQRYLEPPQLDLEACFKDSRACTPLVFILSPGAGTDPMTMLLKYADGLKVQVCSNWQVLLSV